MKWQKEKLIDVLHPFLRAWWYVTRPKTLGVKCVIMNRSKVLMIRNTYGRGFLWTFPGGGIKKGESPEAAVRREVFEEVGIGIDTLRFMGSFIAEVEFKKDLLYVFLANSSEEPHPDNREVEEVKYFPMDHLPSMGPNAKRVLQIAINR